MRSASRGHTGCRTMHCLRYATTISRLLYAAPAWWGCASAADRERFDRFLRKLHRVGYSHTANIDDLIKPAEVKLLCKVKKIKAMSPDRYSRHWLNVVVPLDQEPTILCCPPRTIKTTSLEFFIDSATA